MTDDNRMTITDDNGQEREVHILSNFDAPDGRHFVLFEDPANPDAGVYAYQYDDDGNMDVVLGHAPAGLGRGAHQPVDHASQLVGELDVVLRLLCSSQVIPFDAVTFKMLPVFTARQQQKVS